MEVDAGLLNLNELESVRFIRWIHEIGEDFIALTGSFGDQVLATFKVAIDGSGCNARLFGRFRQCESL